MYSTDKNKMTVSSAQHDISVGSDAKINTNLFLLFVKVLNYVKDTTDSREDKNTWNITSKLDSPPTVLFIYFQ